VGKDSPLEVVIVADMDQANDRSILIHLVILCLFTFHVYFILCLHVLTTVLHGCGLTTNTCIKVTFDFD